MKLEVINPYEPVVINNTPDRLGILCQNALPAASSIVFIDAWNEWTKGNVLLPEDRRGTGYLVTVERVFSL